MALTVDFYFGIAYMDVGKERELGAEALRYSHRERELQSIRIKS